MKYLTALLLLTSCANILNRGQTQYALQKYTKAETLDSHFIIKFNPRTIFNIADTCKAKYIVLAQTSSFCPYVKKRIRNLKRISRNDSIYFIPLLHDYHYNIKSTLDSQCWYNKYKELYFTDRQYFKGGLNPHGTYNSKVLSYYVSKKLEDSSTQNLYMEYKGKIIIFDISDVEIKKKSVLDLLNNAKKIEPKIYYPPNLSKEIINQDFKDNPIK